MRRTAQRAITSLAIWIVSACSAGTATPSPAVTHAPIVESVEPASTPVSTGGAPSTAERPGIGTATLTSEACTFSAEAGVEAAGATGPGFAISVVNDTSDPAGFDLWLLHEDTSYDQWVQFNVEGQANIDAGGAPGSHNDLLPFADPIDLQEAVDPAGTGTLAADTEAPGTYALQCWRFPATGRMRLMAAGPIAVNP